MQFIYRPSLYLKTAICTSLLSLTFLLYSCSSHVPPEIREALPTEIGLETVRSDIDKYISKQIRWGGVVLHVENHKDTTQLTILARPLNSYGRPSSTDVSSGRFIAVVADFLEPIVYKLNREMTFTGIIKGSEVRKVGEFEYNYPVIRVEKYHLWPEIVTTYDSPHPYWLYDPWYDPWYDPFYPYPYRYRY